MTNTVREWIRKKACEMGLHVMDPCTENVIEVNGYVRVIEEECPHCAGTGKVDVMPGKYAWWSL